MSELSKTTVELLDANKRAHDLANRVMVLEAEKEELLEALQQYLNGSETGAITSNHDESFEFLSMRTRKLIAKHRSE